MISTSSNNPPKEWKDYTDKEKNQIYLVLSFAGIFIILWLAGNFLGAIGGTMVFASFYFIYRTIRYSGTRRVNGGVAAFLLLAGIFIVPTPVQDDAAKVQSQSSTPEVVKIELTDTEKAKIEAERIAKEKAEAAEKKAKESSAQQWQPSGTLYTVVGITDGDTIKVSIDGKTETVRFIGMDTPETKDPRKPVQCFGKEATSRMQHYVQSKQVRLSSDDSQDNKDRYGRLLRYVYLEDGRNVAYEMIKGGYAHEYTYNLPYKYQSQFKAAQKSAQENGRGLWAKSTCNGKTNQEHPTKPRVTTPSTQSRSSQPQPAPAPKPKPQPQTSSVYYRNCTAARAAGAAPVYRGQPGYGTHLDRDDDGIGCE